MTVSWYSMIPLFAIICWVSLIFKYSYSYLSNEHAWEKIRGKWVVVTNATTEMGRAFSRALARRGCKLILIGPSEEQLQDLKRSLERIVPVATYAINYTMSNDYSFLERYDIGLLVNKIGFQDSEPARFMDRGVDYIINQCLRGPLSLIRAVLTQMAENKCGYIINIGFAFTERPRAYYSLITSIKAMFRSWSESMYYEMKEYKVNIEYMDSGMIALKSNGAIKPSWICPTPEVFAESVFTTFGHSYFTVPYFAHFIAYLAISVTPKFIVGRYRKHNINNFAKQIKMLY